MIVHLSYYLPELILVHSSALCWLIFVYWQTGELGKFMLCWLIFVYLCTGELVNWWTGHHTAALANSCCAGCYFSKLMARTWGAWPLFFNHLKMFSLPMNVDDRGDNEVEKKLETSKLMQRTPCPCYCYQKDRFFLKKHLERICYVTMRKYWPWFQFSLSPQCCIGSFQLLPIYVTQCNSQQTNKQTDYQMTEHTQVPKRPCWIAF